jgi:WASH complex subunit strumpellin
MWMCFEGVVYLVYMYVHVWCCASVGSSCFSLSVSPYAYVCVFFLQGLQTFVSTLKKSLSPPKPLRKLQPADAKQYEQLMKSAAETRHFVHSFTNLMMPSTGLPRDALKVYPMALGRLAPILALFVEPVLYIGQMQLIRRQISFLMNFTIKMDSNLLSSSLEVFNKSLVADVQAHYLSPDSKPYPDDDNPLLAELSRYLENAGISDPLTKIYITAEPIEHFPTLAFLFVLHTLPRFTYHAQLSTMVTHGKSVPLDWAAFVSGVITLLKQFHSMHTLQFLAHLCQYVRALINAIPQQRKAKATPASAASSSGKQSAPRNSFPAEVVSVLFFLEDFCKFSGLPRKTVESHLPPFVFDHIQL